MESPFCAGDDPDFRLIETFGYVPGQGARVARLDLHLARMARSATAFGIPFDAEGASRLVAGLWGSAPLRCRMTLAADGALDLATSPMPPAAASWRFAIAEARLEADDPMLQHKSTRRALYDQVRRDLLAGVQEMVFLNTRGELCEGTITNIAVTTAQGDRLTPPLASGCLPGIYRQSLLEAGALREAVMTMDDLRQARQIHLMNALRGQIAARLGA
ncbi:aminotransferase class IV family protein [Tritonibacter scottomollicae]|uniref:Probable branched-chain-amino-acid aminotransferase n=1 Tax=Tritonibacter scottomollicae TaxID=483013 RepID=A0A2T1AK46_TRISK|nr:aminotransferase class IV family protein [Tritonibacter scottomollicae]PRZ48979.1 4-amino-4-deoxychorismate lyase [Tritonibacter scottomollicae]